MTYRKRLRDIAGRDVGIVKWNEPLKNHSSWRIGGAADLFVEPLGEGQIVTLVRAVAEADVPLVVVGRGSNLLFPDDGIRGVVMKIGSHLARFSANASRVVAEAGLWVPRFARLAGRHGISGFEHTVGIPGTLGGLVLMNGGSRRQSVGRNVIRLWGVTRSGETVCVGQEGCEFGYRHSKLQESGVIVTRVELEGSAGEPSAIRGEMLAILRERRNKFPLDLPNCGSVFLCHDALHASFGAPGKVIEDAGLKGRRVGGAQVSEKHANFIVNAGDARAGDVIELVRLVRAGVRSSIGVKLECEVRYVDENGMVNSSVFS